MHSLVLLSILSDCKALLDKLNRRAESHAANEQSLVQEIGIV